MTLNKRLLNIKSRIDLITTTDNQTYSTLYLPSVLNDIKSAVNSGSKNDNVNYVRCLKYLGAKDVIIMQLVADGLTVLQIAYKIGVNNRTVEHRILRLRKQLNCRSTTHLAITLLRANVIK